MIIKSDYIRDRLSFIESKVKNDTKQKLYDINKTAEDIFMHLLNDVYGWQLVNANDIKSNFPAIDLIDTHNEIVIQVTSSMDDSKVVSTIEKFAKFADDKYKDGAYKQYADYDLKMFYIKEKPDKFSKATLTKIDNQGMRDDDFLGIEDINTNVSANLDIAKKVSETLSKLIHDKVCELDISKHLATNAIKSNIIGREKELQEIDEQLKASKTLLVKGIGGIGKSTIASNYLHRHKDEYDYYGFFEGIDGFIKDLETKFDIKVEDGRDRLDIVLHKLMGLNENKLLVIDDVKDIKENQEKLEKILGLEHSGYKIILTSREEMEDIEQYDLEVLSMDDAKEFFNSIHKVDDEVLLEEILEEYLDFHALFIEMTAKTLNIKKRTLSLAQLMNQFRNRDFTKIKRDDIQSYHKFLDNFSINDVVLNNEENLLFIKRISILPSIKISFEGLYQFLVCDDEDKLEEFLIVLVRNGWLIEFKNGYKFHQILQDYIRERYTPSLEDIEKIVEYFYEYTSKDDIWIDFLEAITQFLEKFNFKNKKVLELYFSIGKIYFKKYGDYERAKKYLLLNERVWEELKISYDIEHTYHLLADIYEKSEKIDSAFKYINQALKIFKDKKEEKSIVTCYDNLGGIYWTDSRINNNDSQRLDKALFYYQKALDFYLSTTDIIQQANIYNNISLVYKDKKDYSNAHKFLEKAFALDIDDKKEVAQFYNNRGELYTEEGEYELAEKDILLAFNMREELYLDYELDENHDYFAESYDNLAIIYLKQEEYRKAKIEQDKAIEIWSYNHDNNYGYLVDARERLVLIEKEL